MGGIVTEEQRRERGAAQIVAEDVLGITVTIGGRLETALLAAIAAGKVLSRITQETLEPHTLVGCGCARCRIKRAIFKIRQERGEIAPSRGEASDCEGLDDAIFEQGRKARDRGEAINGQVNIYKSRPDGRPCRSFCAGWCERDAEILKEEGE